MSSCLSLPQPCPASWADMTPTVAGRHCAACHTEVVDFTQKSPAEILAYLRQAGDRPVCGRVRTAQLAGPVAVGSRWRRWAGSLLVASSFSALLPGLAAGTTPAVASLASGPVHTNFARFQLAPELPRQLQKPLAASPIVVQGLVLDARTRTHAPGVTILLKDTQLATSTDANGHFELTVTPKGRHIELVVAFVGYKRLVRKLSVKECASPITILLEADGVMLGLLSPTTHPRS